MFITYGYCIIYKLVAYSAFPTILKLAILYHISITASISIVMYANILINSLMVSLTIMYILHDV
jgi:hypothetical protein